MHDREKREKKQELTQRREGLPWKTPELLTAMSEFLRSKILGKVDVQGGTSTLAHSKARSRKAGLRKGTANEREWVLI